MARIDDGLAFMLKYENVARYQDGTVRILDRRVYPHEVRYVVCKDYREVAQAIADMVRSGEADIAIATEAVDRLRANLGQSAFAVNLIHSPAEPAHEMATAELFLQKGVRLVEASAYLGLTPAIVRYRVAGLTASGPTNRVIAKISRVEVATKFLSPPPERILNGLLAAKQITPEQAKFFEHSNVILQALAALGRDGREELLPRRVLREIVLCELAPNSQLAVLAAQGGAVIGVPTPRHG